MNIFIAIAAFLNLILAGLVFSKNRSSLSHISFSLLSFVLALWAFAFIPYNTPFIFDSLFWIKVIYLLVIFMVGTIYFFSYTFPDNQKPHKSGLIIYSLLNIPVVFVLIATDFFVVDVKNTIYGPETKLGLAYPFVSIIWATFAFLSFFEMIKKYRRSIGRFKLQLRYMLIGLGLFSLAAIILDGFIPIFFHTSAYFSLSAAFSLFFVALTGYSMVKHRLMDIRVALQELITFSLVTSLVSTIFIASALVYWIITNTQIKTAVIGIIILISSLISLVISRVYQVIRIYVGRYLFHSLYDYQKTLKELSSNLSSYLEMPRLADLIIETLIQTMGLDRVSILTRDFDVNHYKIQKTIGFNEENGIALVRDNFLTTYLEKHPQIIVLEEIESLFQESTNQFEKEGFKELLLHMKGIEAALIIPIINSKRLISLIVLGSKKSGDPYTVQDINLLETIASQASIALENARLYKEVQNFNKNLEQKVKEATKELEQSNKMLKQANIKIGLADKVKNDLLTMASHEFRTPTTIINNALWFLDKKEVFDKLGDKESQNLKKIIETMERLNYVVKNMNQMLITTSGDLEIEVTPTQVEILIQEVVEDKNTEAREKQIALAYQEPKELLPEIPADKVKLKYVLWELITNALKYTKKEGRIIISASVKNKNLEIKIKDTGVGIPAEALPHIFEGFKKIDLFHKTQSGMGLGLYVVKKIVDLHKGKINIKSEAGRGTVVEIYLPVKDLSEIKTKNFSQDEEVANYHQRQESFADYSNIKENKLPHYLHIIKYLAAFQTASAFFRVY